MALLFGVAALAIPTVIRAAVSGVVTGCEFTPYLPFVLVCAILLRWWQASIFLASSAMIIGVAIILRRVIAALRGLGADESGGGIVFSLEKADAWASWYGQGTPIRLGSQRKVSEMMADFLAQVEIAKRLKRR